MDYKEKYNKLVEAVKVLQEANPSDDGIQNWVNDNVPELRESEDERIRKGLIEFFEDWKETKSHLWGMKVNDILAWLEKQGQVKESEISQPIKETSKENDNSLTIQNGIILDGVAYELTANFPDKEHFFCNNCELYEKCRELEDETLCEFFGAASYRKVFRKVKIERKL